MNSEIEYQRLLSLRINLQTEIRGAKGHRTPTTYMQIKKEFNIRGSRAKVLKLFSEYIEGLRDDKM